VVPYYCETLAANRKSPVIIIFDVLPESLFGLTPLHGFTKKISLEGESEALNTSLTSLAHNRQNKMHRTSIKDRVGLKSITIIPRIMRPLRP
jgi:hypothetical protein